MFGQHLLYLLRAAKLGSSRLLCAHQFITGGGTYQHKRGTEWHRGKPQEVGARIRMLGVTVLRHQCPRARSGCWTSVHFHPPISSTPVASLIVLPSALTSVMSARSIVPFWLTPWPGPGCVALRCVALRWLRSRSVACVRSVNMQHRREKHGNKRPGHDGKIMRGF